MLIIGRVINNGINAVNNARQFPTALTENRIKTVRIPWVQNFVGIGG